MFSKTEIGHFEIPILANENIFWSKFPSKQSHAMKKTDLLQITISMDWKRNISNDQMFCIHLQDIKMMQIFEDKKNLCRIEFDMFFNKFARMSQIGK